MMENKIAKSTETTIRHIRTIDQFLRQHRVIESLGNILMGIPYRLHRKFQEHLFQDDIYQSLSNVEAVREAQVQQIKAEWLPTYDPYSGENLCAVAEFQAERYNMPNFPKTHTKEYKRLESAMDRLGMNIKQLINTIGEEQALTILKSDDGRNHNL